jgi:hypothetical protein
MVHYPSAIRKIGSLVNYCTLRFEAKHSFFKTAQIASRNHKNLPSKIAKKHQISFANNLMNANLLNQDYLVLRGTDLKVKDLNNELKAGLNEVCELYDDDLITLAKELQYFGQIYKKNYVVY